ncbi:MAG: flippase [Patescibacteria group bacterium]
MSESRKLVANAGIQIIGRFLTLLISLVTLSYIANHLLFEGSALKGYGQYTIVLTYISIIGATADLGLFTLVVREITGKRPEVAGRIVGSALVFRFLLMLATLLILGGLYNFLPYDGVVKQGIILGVVIAFLMLFSQAIATIFQANYLSGRIVVSEIIGRLVMAILTIYFLRQGLGLIPVIVANLIGNVVLLVVSYLLSRTVSPIKIQFDFSLWKQTLPEFWSIAVVTLLGLVHFRLDSLILSFYKPVTDVGIYGVAYRIFDIILVIPAIFAANLLPILTRLNDTNRKTEIAQLIKRSTGLLFAASFALGAAIMILAPWIIVFVTSADFTASALPLRILTSAFIFLFLTTIYAGTAIALREQKRLIGGYCLVVMVDIILNIILVPRFSYIGAAATTVTSEVVLMVYSFFLLTKLLPIQLRQLPIGLMTVFAVAVSVAGVLVHQFLIPTLDRFENLGKFGQGAWLTLTSGLIILLAFGMFKLIFRTKTKLGDNLT